MKDINVKPVEPNRQSAKKAWQKPTIEIIARDIIKSGTVAGTAEGAHYKPGTKTYILSHS